MAGIIVIRTALALGLAFILASCPYNPQYGIMGTPNRFVNIQAEYGKTPVEQYLVTAYPDVQPNDLERYEHNEWLVKVELNYGDGSGWQDFTKAYKEINIQFTSHDISVFNHTYAQAGTYTILIRATFWNGEVVNTEADGTVASAIVTVPHD